MPVLHGKLCLLSASFPFKKLSVILCLLVAATVAHADTAKERFGRAMAFYKEKHFDSALDELEAARKLAPEDDTILNWIGWINLSEGRFNEARGPLEHAIKVKPSSIDAHLNLGNVYDGLKMYNEAVREFDAIIKLKPQSADAYYNLGSVYYKMQRIPESLDAYRKSTKFKPDDPYNWNGLGFVYQSAGRYSDAMAAYEVATHLTSGKPDSYTFLLNYSLAALGVAGKARSLPGTTAKAKADSAYAAARQALALAVKLRPDDYQIRETYAETLFDIGKYAECVPEFEKATELAPKYHSDKPDSGARPGYDPYYNMGVAQEKLSKFAAAADAYRQAVDLAPSDNHTALFRLGEMQYKLNRYDDAVKSFTALTRVDPDNLNGWINLASALHLKGDAEAETIILEEAVNKHKGEPAKMARLRCALAFRYYQKGTDPAGADAESLSHATEQYKEALKLTPNMPEALNGLGLIALRAGNPDEAIARFKQAVTARPNFADALNNLGVAYRSKGNAAQARVYFSRALQVDPNNKLAKENLSNMDGHPKP